MSYNIDFEEALKRNIKYGFNSPKVEFVDKRFLTEDFIQKIPQLLLKEYGIIKPVDLYKNCLNIHKKLKPVFEKILGTEIYYTLGSVIMDNKYIFHFSEKDIGYLTTNKIDKPLKIHAWLTLPSLEIIDMSLSTTYAILHNVEEALGAIYTKHYSEFTGIKYEPMLIGDEFLIQSGGIVGYETY